MNYCKICMKKSVKCHEIRHKTIVGLTNVLSDVKKYVFYNVTFSTLVCLKDNSCNFTVFIWKN